MSKKHILYLTFYFEPDLCAGSFRNSPLATALSEQLENKGTISVMTTLPNRYNTFDASALPYEERGNMSITRIKIPKHKSGLADQIKSFYVYYKEVLKAVDSRKYDMVFASSSRLFTAYLGYKIARKQKVPLYLDMRDIFTDTMKDVLQSRLLKFFVMPVLRTIERRVFTYAKHINLISGGFKSYFSEFKGPIYSEFPNGIDPEFLNMPQSPISDKAEKTIIYAGNIGEGQGLHKIIPAAAKRLGNNYQFIVVGDGGAKQKLIDELEREKVSNVSMRKPMSRKELLEIYQKSDFLFIHLNDYEAFKKVLPSKVFELGAYDKPVIAGVAGYANQFINENIPNRILFLPGDVDDMVTQLKAYQYKHVVRTDFLNKYKRSNINREMAKSILQYV